MSNSNLRNALQYYIYRGQRYQQAIIRGGPRYNLVGEPAGEITPEQAAFAARTDRPHPGSA
jgi:sRNA-binding protein